MDAPIRPGRVAWIGLRPAQRAPITVVEAARIDVDEGVVGDRYRSNGAGKRQVTLIGAEDLAAIARFMGLDRVSPELFRRNILVEGLNLHALKGRRFRIGSAVLEYTDECHPCSRMEEALGPGGYNAMRNRGGITARVIASGAVRIGDPLVRLPQA